MPQSSFPIEKKALPVMLQQPPIVAMTGDETTRLKTYSKLTVCVSIGICILLFVTIILVAVQMGKGGNALALVKSSLAELGAAVSALKAASAAASSGNSPTAYSCSLPATYQAKSVLAAKTWIFLGSSLAGDTATAAKFPAVLKVQEAQLYGLSPDAVLDVASDAPASSLHDQVRLMKAGTPYRSAVLDKTTPVVVIVTYGRSWLNGQQQMFGGAASLMSLVEQLKAIQGGNNSLIDSTNSARFSVLLVAEPDVVHGGVYVPPEYASCPYEPALNAPTTMSRILHREAVEDASLALQNFANAHGYAYLSTDAALGILSLASRRYPTDTCVFRDCQSFSDVGHTMLAALISDCLHSRPYKLPVKS